MPRKRKPSTLADHSELLALPKRKLHTLLRKLRDGTLNALEEPQGWTQVVQAFTAEFDEVCHRHGFALDEEDDEEGGV